MRDKLGRFVKGHRESPATEFKKGECSGKNHRYWKGGKSKLPIGYISTYAPNHPRACRNRIYEHILVAEKKLGRYLKKGEVVHHINGIKDDNREENIIVFPSNGKHILTHTLGKWSRKYDKCKRCFTIDNRHNARGYCERCYKYLKNHNKL